VRAAAQGFALGLIEQAASNEKADDPFAQRRLQSRQRLRAEVRLLETQTRGLLPKKHPIDHDHMEVKVGVHQRAKAVDEDDRADACRAVALRQALPQIRLCASQGVRFALDDFGTGFSSLTYLRQLPVNTLKIDQSFVHDMLRDPDDLTIVEGVVGLSTAFRHQVIAEGVESADHALMLMEMGCYLVQGFGIAKPMPGKDTLAWIKTFKPDPRWLENAAQRLSRDDFQLVLAEVNHRQWLASLQNWMRQDPEHRGSSPPLDGHECNFGHWYYGDGEKRYGHLPEYRDAEAVHLRIHGLAQQLVLQNEHGEESISRQTESELIGAAEEFRDILARIRTTVKHTDAGQ